MTLLSCEKGKTYIVRDVSMERDTEVRLKVLGLTGGTRLQLLNKKRCGTMIIKVRGTRLAIGERIAAHIWVEVDRKWQNA